MPAQTNFTLQSRIIVYIIITAIILISIFTFIEITNQFAALTRYNILKAKLGTMVAKNELENALLKTKDGNQYIKTINNALENLKQSNAVENVNILDEDGQIVASTNKYLLNLKLPSNEQHIIKDLFSHSSQFYSIVDRQQNLILQYMPLYAAECSVNGSSESEDTTFLETQEKSDKISLNANILYVAKFSYSLTNINDTLMQVYIPCIFIAVLVIIISIFLGVILSKKIIGPLNLLNNATKEIAAGNLHLRVNLTTGDEIEEVANTFNDMTAALVRMKERAENANPLTKLPGNNVIHEEIEKRIADRKKFVVVYSDLDNFKAFNDKYGIGLGDEAIKLTATILQESIKRGNPDDFVGHEGGDDFVLLTTPEKAETVTNYIMNEFDKRIRLLYDKQDLERGYIVTTSREGQIKQFPIMTISLAGVSNITQPLTNYGQITNICASVKKVAKNSNRSIFVLDKAHV